MGEGSSRWCMNEVWLIKLTDRISVVCLLWRWMTSGLVLGALRNRISNIFLMNLYWKCEKWGPFQKRMTSITVWVPCCYAYFESLDAQSFTSKVPVTADWKRWSKPCHGNKMSKYNSCHNSAKTNPAAPRPSQIGMGPRAPAFSRPKTPPPHRLLDIFPFSCVGRS